MLARLALVLPSHVLWLNQKDNVRQESCNSVALFESLSLTCLTTKLSNN